MLLSVELLGEQRLLRNLVMPLSRGMADRAAIQGRNCPQICCLCSWISSNTTAWLAMSLAVRVFSYNIFCKVLFFPHLYEQSRALREELLKCLFLPCSPFFPSLPPPACVMFIGTLVSFSFLEPADFPQSICYPGKPRAPNHHVLMHASPAPE